VSHNRLVPVDTWKTKPSGRTHYNRLQSKQLIFPGCLLGSKCVDMLQRSRRYSIASSTLQNTCKTEHPIKVQKICTMGFKGLILTLLSVLALSYCNAEVIELTDATFEHETQVRPWKDTVYNIQYSPICVDSPPFQASTGMTTGSWFVLFKAENCAHCAKLRPKFKRLGEDEEVAEKGIILATVNVPANRQTSVRFDIKGFPVLLFFHRGRVYKFKGHRTFDVLKKFLLEGIDTMQGDPIPTPLSGIELVFREVTAAGQDFYDAAVGRGGTVGIAVAVLTLMFFGLIAALVAMCFWPSSSDKHKKT
jgi:thioredoxin domain-containing protein 5